MLAHWLSLITAAPGLGCVPPLIIYLAKKNQSRFIAFHALQSVLFHLLALLTFAASGSILFIFQKLTFGLIGVVISPFKLLTPLFFLAYVLYIFYVGIKAKRGELYPYVIAGPIARGTVGI
jgi:hypothetical protein